MHICTVVDAQCNASVSDEFPIQAPATAGLQLHSALVDGPRSDMDNPQVYIRHKDVRPSSHQKNHFFSTKKIFGEKKNVRQKKKKNAILLVF